MTYFLRYVAKIQFIIFNTCKYFRSQVKTSTDQNVDNQNINISMRRQPTRRQTEMSTLPNYEKSPKWSPSGASMIM